MANIVKHAFQTSDTALAAYLSMEGFELTKDYSNPHKAIFVFENNSKALNVLIRAYNMGTATGNIVQFFYNYRKLISEIQREIKLYGGENTKE